MFSGPDVNWTQGQVDLVQNRPQDNQSWSRLCWTWTDPNWGRRAERENDEQLEVTAEQTEAKGFFLLRVCRRCDACWRSMSHRCCCHGFMQRDRWDQFISRGKTPVSSETKSWQVCVCVCVRYGLQVKIFLFRLPDTPVRGRGRVLQCFSFSHVKTWISPVGFSFSVWSKKFSFSCLNLTSGLSQKQTIDRLEDNGSDAEKRWMFDINLHSCRFDSSCVNF